MRIVLDRPSPNHDARPPGARVRLLVLHYTGMPSAEVAMARLRDPAAKVSAHYLIDDDGTIAGLVAEERRAWHAGIGGWRGIDDVNAWSIGIELVNPGHEWGYRSFPTVQIEALIELGLAICRRHELSPAAVIGHSDVAPARKTDPGELFPWRLLAGFGLGIWPDSDSTLDSVKGADSADAPLADLARIGYRFDLPHTVPAQVVAAFQRHWRPSRVDGVIDRETRAMIRALARLQPGDAAST